MVGGIALGIAGTWVVGNAGIQTLAVCAHLCDLTLLVRGTPDWNTANIWVASVSLGAVAHRLVVVDIALSVGSAVARVNTVSVVTRLSLRTVVVGLASNNDWLSYKYRY